MKALVPSLVALFLSIMPDLSYASNDSTKVRKSWQNKIEIGTMAGSFFDGEGYHLTGYQLNENQSLLNFSIAYQIRIKNDQIFKLRWFSYSRVINPFPDNYVPPRGSESGPGYRSINVSTFRGCLKIIAKVC